MTYTPTPIDTRQVEVPENLRVLLDLLARNAHDVWAAQRIAEGWVWGPQRCDHKKHHPDLVPYDELPESEKHYDRQLSLQTLSVIISFGYQIVRDGECPGAARVNS
jgi:hypothetical protein